MIVALPYMFIALAAWAFWSFRDEISGTLLVSEIAAFLVLGNMGPPDVAVWLCAFEMLFVLVMVSAISIRRQKNDYAWGPRSRRAQAIGFLSLAKIILMFSYRTNGVTTHWMIYAASFNALFVLQALTAGGRTDAILAFITNMFDKFHGGIRRSLKSLGAG
jgi:hypothetical protein